MLPKAALRAVLLVTILFLTSATRANDLPIPVVHVTDQDVFEAHMAHLTPSMQRYIHRLYQAYRDNGWKYAHPSKLLNFILKEHHRAEQIFKDYSDPINKKIGYEIIYAVSTSSKRWGLEGGRDYAIAFIDNEDGFDNIFGDKLRCVGKKLVKVGKHKKYKKIWAKNAREDWAIGYTQIHMDTAVPNLKSRGIDPTGLTMDDLIYFRLVNIDIGICVLASKINTFGVVDGTKAYNAGDGSWQDGRSDKYYDSVSEIYMERDKWQE